MQQITNILHTKVTVRTVRQLSVETLTDNKNRTAANVKSAFTKGNGNVGTPGCVSFMFDQ